MPFLDRCKKTLPSVRVCVHVCGILLNTESLLVDMFFYSIQKEPIF